MPATILQRKIWSPDWASKRRARRRHKALLDCIGRRARRRAARWYYRGLPTVASRDLPQFVAQDAPACCRTITRSPRLLLITAVGVFTSLIGGVTGYGSGRAHVAGAGADRRPRAGGVDHRYCGNAHQCERRVYFARIRPCREVAKNQHCSSPLRKSTLSRILRCTVHVGNGSCVTSNAGPNGVA
jgi:hypothetical protein